MKSLAIGLATLVWGLAWSPREVLAPTRTEDPPIECPLCGGNVALHASIVTALTSANARVGLRTLAAFQA